MNISFIIFIIFHLILHTPIISELSKVTTETYLLQIKDLTDKLDRQ